MPWFYKSKPYKITYRFDSVMFSTIEYAVNGETALKKFRKHYTLPYDILSIELLTDTNISYSSGIKIK